MAERVIFGCQWSFIFKHCKYWSSVPKSFSWISQRWWVYYSSFDPSHDLTSADKLLFSQYFTVFPTRLRTLNYSDHYLLSEMTSCQPEPHNRRRNQWLNLCFPPPLYHLPVLQAQRLNTAHSLHTTAAETGAPVSTLKAMGHWSSAASECYLFP